LPGRRTFWYACDSPLFHTAPPFEDALNSERRTGFRPSDRLAQKNPIKKPEYDRVATAFLISAVAQVPFELFV
jgi:hypothetical protein